MIVCSGGQPRLSERKKEELRRREEGADSEGEEMGIGPSSS